MERIRIHVLMDNNTYIDQYYLGEPAVSYYIEAGDKKILFDTGYSSAFIDNAAKMGISLEEITHLVFSHGHNDHTRGLCWLRERIDLSRVEVIAHPGCFHSRYDENGLDIGSPLTEEEIQNNSKYHPAREPYYLSDKCIFLGEIPKHNGFEERKAFGIQKIRGIRNKDYVYDDSALVLRTEDGLFIVTGCSHSGICNITEHAMEVCGDRRIAGILGGFHLFEIDSRLDQTIRYLADCRIPKLYPCHCVSFRAKAKMNEVLELEEVGVGLCLTLSAESNSAGE